MSVLHKFKSIFKDKKDTTADAPKSTAAVGSPAGSGKQPSAVGGSGGASSSGGKAQPHIWSMSPETKQNLAKGVKYNLKIVIRGLRRTGKSSLMRMLNGMAPDPQAEYTPTSQIAASTIHFPSAGTTDPTEGAKVDIWEVVDEASSSASSAPAPDRSARAPSQDGTIALDATSLDIYKNCNAAIFMIDCTRRDTFDYAKREAALVPPHCSVLLCLNFYDKDERFRVVSDHDVDDFCQSLNGAYTPLVLQAAGGVASAIPRDLCVAASWMPCSMATGMGFSAVRGFLDIPFALVQLDTLERQMRGIYRAVDSVRAGMLQERAALRFELRHGTSPLEPSHPKSPNPGKSPNLGPAKPASVGVVPMPVVAAPQPKASGGSSQPTKPPAQQPTPTSTRQSGPQPAKSTAPPKATAASDDPKKTLDNFFDDDNDYDDEDEQPESDTDSNSTPPPVAPKKLVAPSAARVPAAPVPVPASGSAKQAAPTPAPTAAPVAATTDKAGPKGDDVREASPQPVNPTAPSPATTTTTTAPPQPAPSVEVEKKTAAPAETQPTAVAPQLEQQFVDVSVLGKAEVAAGFFGDDDDDDDDDENGEAANKEEEEEDRKVVAGDNSAPPQPDSPLAAQPTQVASAPSSEEPPQPIAPAATATVKKPRKLGAGADDDDDDDVAKPEAKPARRPVGAARQPAAPAVPAPAPVAVPTSVDLSALVAQFATALTVDKTNSVEDDDDDAEATEKRSKKEKKDKTAKKEKKDKSESGEGGAKKEKSDKKDKKDKSSKKAAEATPQGDDDDLVVVRGDE